MMTNLHLPNEAFIFYCSFPEDATERHFSTLLFSYSLLHIKFSSNIARATEVILHNIGLFIYSVTSQVFLKKYSLN